VAVFCAASTQSARPLYSRPGDPSPDQKAAVEALLGSAIAGNEEISIRTLTTPSPPDWLKESWESAKRQGVDQLSLEDIAAEIAAARKARRERRSSDQ